MERDAYRTPGGVRVPAVTAAEMRAVDRTVVDEVGLALVQMMEHAGRGLAATVLERAGDAPVTVMAGNGGNGGGGLACSRHLANRDVDVRVVLDRAPEKLDGVTAEQLRILQSMDVPVAAPEQPVIEGAVVDALIGYGLQEAPRGRAETLIEAVTPRDDPVVSLDVPSGVDATTGDRPGAAVEPDLTVSLALPKTGLSSVDGDVRLVDLSIPATVYERHGLDHEHPFGPAFALSLVPTGDGRETVSE